jgi:outer membrane immunogenic protein
MKKLLLASVAAAALFSAPALAADYPMKGSPAPAFSWTGFYIGGNLGMSWNHEKWDFNPPVVGGINQSVMHEGMRFLTGGQVGYQIQFGQYVAGIEAAGDWFTPHRWDTSSTFGGGVGGMAAVRIDDIMTVGGRLGFTPGNQNLFYLSGGYAEAKVKTADLVIPTLVHVAGFDTSKTHHGEYVGVGWDNMWAPNWIFGVEYQHVFLDKKLHTVVGTPSTNDHDIKPTADVVRAKLSYLFSTR